MTTDQQKITTEQDAVMILSAIIAYGNGLVWTRRTIAHVTHCSEERVSAAVDRLTRSGYLAIHGGQYCTTVEGEEYYEGAKRQYSVSVSSHAWKTEALTGLVQRTSGRTSGDWQRSTIRNAALPGPPCHPVNETTPEHIIEQLEIARRTKQRICAQLGIDMEEYKARVADGSLHVCKGLDGVSHVGIFDRKGGGWQHICKRCRRRQRELNKGKE